MKEIRSIVASIVSASDDMVLKGLIPYEKESVFIGFTEILKRGCFKKTVNESRDIHFLEEHDETKLRARGKNGSLKVSEDDEGVHFEAILADTTENRDLYTKVKTGLLSNVSFGFQVIKDRRNDRGIREVLEARLFEISAVGSPAYEDTTLSCRSLSSAFEGKEIQEADKEAIIEEINKLQSLLPQEEVKSELPPEEKHEEPAEEVKEESTASDPKVEQVTPPEEPKVDDHYLELVARCDALDKILKELE